MFGTILSINTDNFTDKLLKLLLATDTAYVLCEKKNTYTQ